MPNRVTHIYSRVYIPMGKRCMPTAKVHVCLQSETKLQSACLSTCICICILYLRCI